MNSHTGKAHLHWIRALTNDSFWLSKISVSYQCFMPLHPLCKVWWYTFANKQHTPDTLMTIHWGDTQFVWKVCLNCCLWRDSCVKSGRCDFGARVSHFKYIGYLYCVGNLLPTVLYCHQVCLVIKVSSIKLTYVLGFQSKYCMVSIWRYLWI